MRVLTRVLSVVLLGVLLSPSTRAVALDADRPSFQVGSASSAAPVAAKARRCANGRPSHVYRDPTGDGPRGVESNGIGVWNKDGDACYWVTATGRFRAANAQVIRVVIDTNRRVKGYEYEAWAYSNKDSDNRRGAYLIYFTSPKSSVYVDCPVYSAFLLRQGQIRIGVPKTCVGAPAHIRLSAQVIDIKRYLSGNRYRGLGDSIPNGGYTPVF